MYSLSVAVTLSKQSEQSNNDEKIRPVILLDTKKVAILYAFQKMSFDFVWQGEILPAQKKTFFEVRLFFCC